ncbi:glycosyltransferase family 4 protein [Thalassotalea ganghwensis]
MKVLIIGAYPNSIVEFRGNLIQTLVANGHDVVVMAANAEPKVVEAVEKLGCQFVSYQIERNGLNPVSDLKTFFQLRAFITKWQPEKILAYTIKPIIWGALACRSAKVSDCKFYAMITGLGYAFERSSLLRSLINILVKRLYKAALKHSERVIFQNNDNLTLFNQLGLVHKDKCYRVYGSGVDISKYAFTSLPEGFPTFLLIARLIGDKGIREYALAAKKVKHVYPDARFQLVGPVDTSPDKISLDEIHHWQEQNIIDYLGATDNVIPYLNQCHIYVLPSYHEGLPRTVLEAMAIGRPILTTDTVGCRDTVVEGKNGWLVEVKNVDQLAERLCWFIDHQEKWPDMATASRNMVCESFDVQKVNAAIVNIMELSHEK